MNKAGKYVSNPSREYEYKSFGSSPLPLEINIDNEIVWKYSFEKSY